MQNQNSSPRFEAQRRRVLLQASERAVQMARSALVQAAALYASGAAAGAAPLERVWFCADWLLRELRSQEEVARELGAADWETVAQARLQQHEAHTRALRQAHEAQALAPADVVFADLDPVPPQIDMLDEVAEAAFARPVLRPT